VNADDGLDELSLGSPSTLHVITPQSIDRRATRRARRAGAAPHGPKVCVAATLAHNVEVVRRFVDGERGPVFDVVCANAALALMVAAKATTLSEGFELASASVLEGRAALALERLVALSNA
jgi:anthranilate phosphoribosyltransferase